MNTAADDGWFDGPIRRDKDGHPLPMFFGKKFGNGVAQPIPWRERAEPAPNLIRGKGGKTGLLPHLVSLTLSLSLHGRGDFTSTEINIPGASVGHDINADAALRFSFDGLAERGRPGGVYYRNGMAATASLHPSAIRKRK